MVYSSCISIYRTYLISIIYNILVDSLYSPRNIEIQVIVASEAGEEENKLYNQSTCGILPPELHAKMNI